VGLAESIDSRCQVCKCVYTTKAPSTPATMSKQRSTLSKQHSSLLPKTATTSHEFIVKFSLFDKVETNRTCSICVDFVERTKFPPCAWCSAAYNVGTPAAPTICGQTVFGDRRPHGLLMSPTYPGVYPDNLFCFYRLHGARGQRVRLTFIDLDLYSGGDQ